MKKILLIAFVFSVSCSTVFGQTETIKNFYERYAKEEHANDYSVKGWLLKIASEFSEDDEAGKVLEKISHIRILTMSDGNPISNHEYSDFMKGLQKDQFEELIKIKDKDCHVDFFIREEGADITNVLMMVHEKEGFVLISLEGLLNMKDLKNLHLSVEGGEHFEKLGGKELPRA